MKTVHAVTAMVMTATMLIQPATAQRDVSGQRGPAVARGQLLLHELEEIGEFATRFDLSDDQRARMEVLADGFRAEHSEVLEAIAIARDSMRSNARNRDRVEMREFIRRQQEHHRALRPAFEEFEQQIGDILTWNQGREVAASLAPARFAVRTTRDRWRGAPNPRMDRGPRRPGFRGRMGSRGR